MSEPPDDAALAQEFDVLARRAGLLIPEARRAGLLAGFGDLRRAVSLLRQPRTAASEPASTFAIETVARRLAP